MGKGGDRGTGREIQGERQSGREKDRDKNRLFRERHSRMMTPPSPGRKGRRKMGVGVDWVDIERGITSSSSEESGFT